MKHDRKRARSALLAALTALALLLALTAGCAGDGDSGAQPEDTAVVSGEQQEPSPTPSASAPEEAPGTAQPEASQPADPEPEESVPVSAQPASAPAEPNPEAGKPEDPQPEQSAPAQLEPSQSAQPEESAPAPLADGSYTAAVTLEGGSGKASVASPAALRVENGAFYATLVWSSPNYDYMKVNGQRYDPINTEGNSTFEIPVAALDQKLDVIADTVAMSTPHEVEYTLFFDSSTLAPA